MLNDLTATPPIAHHRTERVREGLDSLRLRLLDLTAINRLISFRHTSATIRVVDAELDTIYSALIGGAKLPFVYVPELTKEEVAELGEKPAARDYAAGLGWSVSYDLRPGQGRADGLPTLFFRESFDTVIRKVNNAAKTAIEESGVNLLHLIFGFLEWRESDDSTQVRQAPLVIVPVRLEVPKAAQEDRAVKLCYDGEELNANLSLIEKMRRDFGIELPQLRKEETPTGYFVRVQAAIAHKREWRICHQISTGLLSFAKLLMYLDLDAGRWPDAGLARHPRLLDIFAGEKGAELSFASEYELDEESKREPLPALVCDADSSQHSALIDASRGSNLVIEGPPGTGKSQTITNLIAASLAQGKKILFVAEKMAALNVVKGRLDQAGLGDFCLELHSHKTNKIAVLKSLDDRISAHSSFRDPALLRHRTAALEDHKKELTHYVKLMNEPYGAIGKSPFEIIWARDAARRRLQHEAIQSGAVAFARADAWDSTAFEKRKSAVEIYQAHLLRYAQSGGAVDSALNPWSWLPTSGLDFAKQEALLRHLRTLREVSEAHIDLLRLFVHRFQEQTSDPKVWLPLLPGWRDALPVLEKHCSPEILAGMASAEQRRTLSKFLEDVADYRTEKAALSSAGLLMDGAIAAQSLPLMRTLEGRGLGSWTLGQLSAVVEKTDEASRWSASAAAVLQAFAEALGIEAVFSMECLDVLLSARGLLDHAPMELFHLRGKSFEQEGFNFRLRAAQKECDELREQRARCAADFDFERAPSQAALEEAAVILEVTPWLKRLFGGPFRRAKQLHAEVCRHKEWKVASAQMAGGLRYLSGQLRKVESYEYKYRQDAAIGPVFSGIETNWTELIRLADWYEAAMVSLPGHLPFSKAVQRALLDLPAARLKGIQKRDGAATPSGELSTFRAALEPLLRSLPHLEGKQNSASLEAVLREAKATADFARSLLTALAPLRLPPNSSAADIRALFEQAASLNTAREALSRNPELERLLGARFKGVETECAGLEATLSLANHLMEGPLPPELKLWLLHAEYEPRRGWLQDWLARHEEGAHLVAATSAEIRALLGRLPAFNRESSLAALEATTRSLRACLSAAHLLPMWIEVLHAREGLHALELNALVDMPGRRALPIQELTAAFEFLFHDSLLRLLFNEQPALWQLSGTSHEETRRKFADLDKAVIEMTRLRIAFAASRTLVPHGSGGKAKEKTELALIEHEIHKQRSHISVRQLLSRAGQAVQALKPCFMMSPMSVAQFLEPGALDFDLVVMDEASQLRPEDALGAVARGTQVVVVGDPKQLPPTSFFQRAVADEESDEERTAAEEAESILDVSLSLYQPVRRLRWHYRSQHHSLIAFSNSEFYDNNLIVFPSAYQEHPDLGVKFVDISGIFERRRNQIEAERVVEAVLEHMELHPSESLGVVTMNFDQRELIEELLYARLRNDSFASTWLEQRDETAEPFFIKNLENVQGDERDVILISVTYGKDSQGNIFQRFAGVNSQSGHRRLNVMVTRAKKRTVVFSSLDPDDVHVTPSTSWGVRALRSYLEFAKRGIRSQPIVSPGAEPSNEHEAAVGTLLKENGFDVVPQVGVSGYFIDLAVRHPENPGAFLLGIEFDGKSYHSGRSARDRDRLRQMVLESQGWKMARIWSTDWFKNRDAEAERLLRRVRDLSRAADSLQR